MSIMQKKNNPIEQAIKSRNVECLKLLLEQSKNRVDAKDYTALMIAIKHGQVQAVPLLLQNGEDPSFFTKDKNECALQLACFQKQTEVVKILCDALTVIEPDPDKSDKSAVHWACSSHDAEIVKIILDKGIDVNRLDKLGHSGPFYMLDVGEDDEVIKILELLIEYNFNVNIQGKNENGGMANTILGDFVSSITKPCKVIEWLLQHGADPTRRMVNGERICDFIRKAPGSEQIQRLIEQNANQDEFIRK